MTESETDLAPLRAFCAAMCDAAAPTQIAADLPGFLTEHGVGSADREALAGHGGRLLMYRKMVHNRLRGVVEDFLPRTAEQLGKARMRAELAAFMAEQAPRSPRSARKLAIAARNSSSMVSPRSAQAPASAACRVSSASSRLHTAAARGVSSSRRTRRLSRSR